MERTAVNDFEDRSEALLCECHLVSFGELAKTLKTLGSDIKLVCDLKKHKIIGHGCGQCIKNWEFELTKLIDSQKF